jgi:ABC-type Fe3+/spermidine/putrescine transport system ATPase subunit
VIVSEIELIDVCNRFLKNVRLRVSGGKTFVIVGPSGAGKTSLLRAIAGLAPHRGTIAVDGCEIQHLPPHLRKVGYVSQDLYLFPHLSVEGNLRIAMERLHVSRDRKQTRAKKLMELLRIAQLAERFPRMLSGGEKQRAALARALASEPKILLLDEPLSKLDFRSARHLRYELRALLKRLGLTAIFVTHNMEEAREMADDLAVMREGILTPVGPPAKVWVENSWPADSFLERPNVLSPVFMKFSGNGLVKITWAGAQWYVPDEGREFNQVAVSPSGIDIGAEPPAGPSINRFTATVRSVDHADDSVRVAVRVNGEELRVEMPAERGRELGLVPGELVHGFIGLKSFEIV